MNDEMIEAAGTMCPRCRTMYYKTQCLDCGMPLTLCGCDPEQRCRECAYLAWYEEENERIDIEIEDEHYVPF
jgi:hypothetical protein